jgi:hypothetical protein
MPQYLIKVDNIDIPDSLQGIKAFDATSVSELMTKIREYYSIAPVHQFELWTARMGTQRTRVDMLKDIPCEYDILWVRGCPSQSTL